MLRGWEGNRRSGVTLAMRHGLSGLSTYGLKGLRKGDERPTYAPLGYGTFTLLSVYKAMEMNWYFVYCN